MTERDAIRLYAEKKAEEAYSCSDVCAKWLRDAGYVRGDTRTYKGNESCVGCESVQRAIAETTYERDHQWCEALFNEPKLGVLTNPEGGKTILANILTAEHAETLRAALEVALKYRHGPIKGIDLEQAMLALQSPAIAAAQAQREAQVRLEEAKWWNRMAALRLERWKSATREVEKRGNWDDL